jgi:hypothetical protein
MDAIAQLFQTDSVMLRIEEMYACMEVALRVAECGTAIERRQHAETVVRVVMGRPITEAALQLLEPALSRIPLSPSLAASATFASARLLIEQEAKGAGHFRAKLKVNKMEKSLIAFVRNEGVQPWPQSCEFIVGPYASASQFAQVQARYAASRLASTSTAVKPDPNGLEGA